jgi:hypothetical protein
MTIRIFTTWIIHTDFWHYAGPGFDQVGSIDQQAEEIYYRYHRLRDEDRPMLIQIYGSGGLGDCLADRLVALGLPAAYVPRHQHPQTLITMGRYLVQPR